MADRTITTRLALDPSQYESGMQRAKKATEGLGTAAKQTGDQTSSAMQRMVRSARDNRQAWTEVGGALTVVGGATTALMAAVAKTGIEYNSLRQTATQGLVAVTGSTEAATEQMRKLDEYGQNSWLMRDSLIRAQQQMTGFGIETEKVIPYMDALAEGVAAAGGSNQTFEELAFVMGKVNSSGKITAETFNEFGMRGIDAAQMIADAMGTTAAQVREDVTSGALDAGVALDALAEGLVMNFEGSSDLVRNTFRGAVDDVSAAFRDLSAIAMTPFVDPEGGGLLTALMGQVADLLFMLRDELPDGIIQAGGVLTGLGGLAALAGGGFALLFPKVVSTVDSLVELGVVSPRTLERVRDFGPVAGRAAVSIGKFAVALGAAFAAMHAARGLSEAITGLGDAVPSVDLLVARLETAGEAISGFDMVLADLNLHAFDDFAQANERLANLSGFDKFLHDLGLSATRSEDAAEAFANMGEALVAVAEYDMDLATRKFAEMADEAGATDQAAIDLINNMPAFRDELEKMALAAGLATDDSTLLRIALGLVGDESDAAADASGRLGGAQEELTGELDLTTSAIELQAEALRGLIDAHREHYDTILSERGALRDLEAAFDDATEAIKDNGATLDITTEKGRANEAALDNIASSAHTVTDRMRELGTPTEEIAAVMDRAREEFIEAATGMGMAEDKAADLATELGLLPREVFIDVEARMNAEAQIAAFRERWDGVNIATAWVQIRARDNLTAGQAASGARYTAQALAHYNRGGRAAGGWVPGPYPGEGVDNVMWPLAAGGKVLNQPLAGGEYVVNARQAARHAALLDSINAGRLSGLARGGRVTGLAGLAAGGSVPTFTFDIAFGADFSSLLTAYDAVVAKNREVAEAAAAASKDAEDSWEDFYDGHSVEVDDFIRVLGRQFDEQAAWQNDLLSLSGRVSTGMVDYLYEAGERGEALVSALVDATDDELRRMDAIFERQQRIAERRLREVGRTLAELAEDDLALAQQEFARFWEEAYGDPVSSELLRQRMPEFMAALADLATRWGLATDEATLYALATGEVSAATADLIDTFSRANQSFISLSGAYDTVVAKNRELAQATASAMESGTASWQDFYDGVSVSMGDYLSALQAQVDAQREWQVNMLLLSGRVSEGLLAELAAMGERGAPLVAAFVDASDAELRRLESLWSEGGQLAGDGFATTLAASGDAIEGVIDQWGLDVARTVAEGLSAGWQTAKGLAVEYEELFTDIKGMLPREFMEAAEEAGVMREQLYRGAHLIADEWVPGVSEAENKFRHVRANLDRILETAKALSKVDIAASTAEFYQSTLRGYAAGGWTGDLPVGRVAGVTHGQEFVVKAPYARENLALLSGINAGLRPAQYMPAGGGGGGAAPVVNVTALVENPWGEGYLEARVRRVAQDESQHALVRASRKGRR